LKGSLTWCTIKIELQFTLNPSFDEWWCNAIRKILRLHKAFFLCIK
jgi:hypothetical protein